MSGSSTAMFGTLCSSPWLTERPKEQAVARVTWGIDGAACLSVEVRNSRPLSHVLFFVTEIGVH